MNQLVIGIMVFFMAVGALDKALLNGRLGYGAEFEKGLSTMGPLTLMMAGIMCIAPVLGSLLSPVFSPLFTAIGSDPGMLGGMFIAVDMGGFPLSQSLALRPESPLLSGIALGCTLGGIISFTIPVSLSMADNASRPFIAKGIVAGIIASPFAALGTGLAAGIPPSDIFFLTLPAIVIAAVLAVVLTFFQRATIRFFLVFARILAGLAAIWLACGIIEHFFPVTVIPGMDRLKPQLTIIGEIGIMLAGAYPMVHFLEKAFRPALQGLARLLRVDGEAALGMVVSVANPLPMYAMQNRMSPRGQVVCAAFAADVMCMLGDHLGYISAVAPDAITPMLAGKALSAAAAVAFALLFERLSPSGEP